MNNQPPLAESGDMPSLQHQSGRTPLANSRRLLAMFGDIIRFVPETGSWLVWNGRFWEIDSQKLRQELAKRVVDSMWREASQLGSDAGESDARKWAAKSADDSQVRKMINLASSDPSVVLSASDLNSDPWKINAANGTIDLKTGELIAHDPADNLTMMTAVDYHQGFDTDSLAAWSKFLTGVFPDETLREWVRRLIGYALCGLVTENILPVFCGSGANGKSVFLNALKYALGPYFYQAPSDLLLARRDDTHPAAFAQLKGRRLVSCTETDDGRRLAEATVKGLTGGDPINARGMYQNPYTFDPTHTIILTTNHKPTVHGTDHGLWRRLRLVPFETKFWDPDRGESGPSALRQDKGLSEALHRNAGGILAWAVQGCLEWRKRGLGSCESIEQQTAQYRTDSDIIGRFVSDRCETDPTAETALKAIHQSLAEWCRGECVPVPTNRRLSSWLLDQGHRSLKRGTTMIQGITLG